MGFEHWYYKPEKTPEGRLQRNMLRSTQQRLWARAIRHLYDQECAIDGAFERTSEDYTQVHHVVPWEHNPESRFLLSNGVPLRVSHHREYHYEFEPELGVRRGQSSLPEWREFYHRKTGRDYRPLFEHVVPDIVFPITCDSTRLREVKRRYHEQGFNYIPLYPYEVRTKITLLRSMLGHRDQGGGNAIGARSLGMVTLTTSQARPFFEANHIQGYTAAATILALVRDDIVYAAMAFSRARIRSAAESSHPHELVRFATRASWRVPGAASRLFRAYLSAPPAKLSEIVTYADRRFCVDDPQATMYPRLGFEFSHASAPSYRYTDANGTFLWDKKSFQRRHLPRKLGEAFDHAKTERANMEAAGFYRLYDCGTFVYRLLA